MTATSTIGIVGTSAKENEFRLPVHPAHLARIAPSIRKRMTLERGYGQRFGYVDDDLVGLVGAIADRSDVIAESDVVVLPKPQHSDVERMREGAVLWGWPHCVQDVVVTQIAIDRRLTLIAFEAMNHWTLDGSVGVHVFHKNNELAGYSSVLHALALTGSTGDYGRRLRAVVIGFGATARGAVTALNAHGIHDVHVLTNRDVAAVGSPIHSAAITRFDHDRQAPYLSHVVTDRGRTPLAPFLAERDVIVNCTLQDTEHPLVYVMSDDLHAFRRGTLIVDVSCDEGMGFEWARPTTFDAPMFQVGHGIDYYAVDHSPSYLWNSATWENSEALLPFVDTVMAGPDAWNGNETINRAIEIRRGHVQNPNILSFQGRSAVYPHPSVRGSDTSPGDALG
ncbi:N(5)-(carboxyethyl)ornithine synthase [Gordonia sp. PDNC005]|uniref:N(5)-(carboxyethyl)ornithine synthase n=1 Tax=unclassified Gordonia (in: high G+C Gram-positive bacteria) TaxID=2657482 RepID=UPI0019656A0D|nr:N(5)-(carboxyethyl)ornithine synthase [Gordonia sp. PDNC005]QRY61264.1 N(5)-(carboxyethyl)ornithine synthase [Gordonia sp. PDNC005]